MCPLQRLCKYPLLLSQLANQVRDEAQRDALESALEAMRGTAEHVNERVRQTEGRAALLGLAEALDDEELVTPTRSLLLQTDIEAAGPPCPKERLLWCHT